SYYLSPIFSPENDFIFPLAWIWDEQETYIPHYIPPIEVELEEEKPEFMFRSERIDWDKILYCWEPILLRLLERKEFSILELQQCSEEEKEKWLEEAETFELWVMFGIQKLKIEAVQETDVFEDERLKLIQKLVARNPVFQQLFH